MKQNANSQNRLRAIAFATATFALFAAGRSIAAEVVDGLRYVPREVRVPKLTPQSNRVGVPEALRIALPDAARIARHPSGHPTRPQDHGWLSRLDTRAREAGNQAADERSRNVGRREYYRVGFYEGVQRGLNPTYPPRWAWVEGHQAGNADRDARARGRESGRTAAEISAEDEARAQVRGQFGDLSRDPEFRPTIEIPRYVPRPFGLDAPRLRDVVREYPVLDLQWMGGYPREYLSDFEYGTWQLIRCPDYSQFYDAAWSRTDSAWNAWKAREGNRVGFSELDSWERERFSAVFSEAFERRLAIDFERTLDRVFASGFDDGWVYGSFLNEELRYREGYRSGYLEAIERSSRDAFDATFPVLYGERYSVAFDDWSRSAKLEIDEMRLSDADDDGVFSPGERLIVEYRLVNYGGAGGEFAVELDGRVLAMSAAGSTAVPARSVSVSMLTTAHIDAAVRPRTDSEVELRVAGARRSAALTVSYPLVLDHERIRTSSSNLAGEVTVEIPVDNLSRRAVDGTVRVAAGAGISRSVELGSIAPHGHGTVSVTLAGLDPLSLIAGDVTLHLEVASSGTLHDQHRRDLPDVHRDLDNRELIQFMVGLALQDLPSPVDSARARELMVQRLRVDWNVASVGAGNPYKADYRERSAQTALGDLVRTYNDEQERLRNSEVFAGLSGEVVRLSRTLPGTHPLLRKYVRRLADQLP